MPQLLSIVPRPMRSLIAGRRLRATRLIACDLDGTLLNGDNMIGVATASLIHRIVERGFGFVFITARHHYAAVLFADEIRLDEPIISLDGAMTKGAHDDAPENRFCIGPRTVEEVVAKALVTPGVECACVLGEGIVMTDRDMPVPSRHHHWNIDVVVPMTTPPPDDVLEIVISGTFRMVNMVHAVVRDQERARRIRTRLYESESHGDYWYLEIRSVEANKLRALSAFVQRRGIALSQVVAIGNGRNDVDFCEKSGYAVAVNNAVDRLKRTADFVTARDCTEEGVNEFLEHFLELRR